MCKHKPCKECPFMRNSLPGYLGEASNQPELFLHQLEGATPLVCHMAINWDDYDEEEIERKSFETPCIGALQYMNNQFKQPRYKEHRDLTDTVGTNPEVFKWKTEFINHHS